MRISDLERQLAKKEEQLSQFRDLGSEVLAVSEDALQQTKADKIMAQVNLDVIESHGS